MLVADNHKEGLTEEVLMKACEVSSRMAEMRASSYGVLGERKKMAWKEDNGMLAIK
jgi:hypothetical protein